jgi:hypothetical protein
VCRLRGGGSGLASDNMRREHREQESRIHAFPGLVICTAAASPAMPATNQ